MGTIPTPPTFSAGAVLTAAQMNTLRDVHNFWSRPPSCFAYQATADATVNNTWKLVTLDAEVFDIVQSGDSPSHDNVTNNSRLVFRTSGIYEVTAQIFFATNSTGARKGQIRLNSGGSATGGTVVLQSNNSPLSADPSPVPMVPIPIQVVAGDYIEMFALQTSGGGLNLLAGASLTFLQARLRSS